MTLFQKSLAEINTDSIREAVADQGWAFLGQPLDQSVLDQIKNEIDKMSESSDVEINYGGTEHRIWKAHEKSSSIEEFRHFSDLVVSKFYGNQHDAYDILAIRNRSLESSSGKLHDGRWHLDSFNRQLKVFVFLSDVTEASGPFEMIPGTQAMSFKMRKALGGHLITPKDIVTKSRSYSKLKEELIESILSQGYERKVFAVPAGTIALVDTSCVHRARPCTLGERYALTSYYS